MRRQSNESSNSSLLRSATRTHAMRTTALVANFLTWCDSQNIRDLSSVEPLHVAVYVASLANAFEKPTIKQHLAAIRVLFNWLVTGQVISANPAISVKGPTYDVNRGLTPILTNTEMSKLIGSIDTSTQVGLRDRALIGLMVFSFARVSAALMMRGEDYFAMGAHRWLRLKEKAGRIHEVPAHRVLQSYLEAYIHIMDPSNSPSLPLFRASGQSGVLLPDLDKSNRSISNGSASCRGMRIQRHFLSQPSGYRDYHLFE